LLSATPAARAKATEPFCASLQEHWNKEVLLDMKLRCYLSRRKYTLIRHLLFQKYNEDTKRWDPLVFNGVELPTPASDKTLMKLKKAIFEEYGVECNATGSRMNVNYRKKLAHDLSVMHYQNRRQLQGGGW
jgi:hypothetical protein